MIASTSHDMKTPLNSMTTMIELIETYNQNPKLQPWIDIAKTSSS